MTKAIKSYVAFKREIQRLLPDAEVTRTGSSWQAVLRDGDRACCGSWHPSSSESLDEFAISMTETLRAID